MALLSSARNNSPHVPRLDKVALEHSHLQILMRETTIQKGRIALTSSTMVSSSSSQEFGSGPQRLKSDQSAGPSVQTSAWGMQSSKMALCNLSGLTPGEEREGHVLDRAEVTDDSSPRHWSLRRKRLLFLALMSSSILCDG